MPEPIVLMFVIALVSIGIMIFLSAAFKPTDTRDYIDEHPVETDIPKPDLTRDRLAEFAKMLSCSRAVNTVNGERVLFDVYVKKEGIYEPEVVVKFKHRSEEREWMDVDFILGDYLLASAEPFKTYTYADCSAFWYNSQAINSIWEYEVRKHNGLKYNGRKSKAVSYEYKVTCE